MFRNIFSVLLLFSLFFPALSQESKFSAGNAAPLYREMWESLPQVDWVKSEHAYQEIKSDTWNDKYPDFNVLLENNGDLFRKFDAASAMDICDFFESADPADIREYSLPVRGDFFKTFYRLIILKIRKLEAENKIDEAFDVALRLLKFSYQLSAEPAPASLPFYGCGMLLRRDLYDYFASVAEKNKKIHDHINEMEKFTSTIHSLKKVIEFEGTFVQRKIKELSADENESAEFFKAHNIDSSLNKNAIFKEYEALLQKLNQKWLKASEAGNNEDFKKIQEEASQTYPESSGHKVETVSDAAKILMSVSVLPWKSTHENDAALRVKYNQLIAGIKKVKNN